MRRLAAWVVLASCVVTGPAWAGRLIQDPNNNFSKDFDAEVARDQARQPSSDAVRDDAPKHKAGTLRHKAYRPKKHKKSDW